MTKKGRLYGVGVGPGEPKLMTLLAVETIENCPVIAVPAGGKKCAVSYRIAAAVVPGIGKKECIDIVTPMTKDKEAVEVGYELAADEIEEKLDEGKDVAYLTLGDPAIYSTYIYIHRIIERRGYEAKIISGIPSFCAVAARLGESLCDRDQQLHVIPSSYEIGEALDLPGTKVLMKSASALGEVKQMLEEKEMDIFGASNCGMDDEVIYRSADQLPDKGSYFTLLIAKDSKGDRIDEKIREEEE